MKRTYFVSGIGTEVGKTVVSAFLCRSLDADYWKPIQAGELDFTDSAKVALWASRQKKQIHPEAFRFSLAASPHYASLQENPCPRTSCPTNSTEIGLGQEPENTAQRPVQLQHFTLPLTDRPLIVEGAGGLLVPINESQTMLDLIRWLDIPVLLVARNYLGSINHTLLSITALRAADIPLAGLIYSGQNYRDNVEIIEKISGVPPLLQLPELEEVSPEHIAALADRYGANLRATL